MLIALYAPEFLSICPSIYSYYIVLHICCKSSINIKNQLIGLNPASFSDINISFTSYDGQRFHLGYIGAFSDIKYLLKESSIIRMYRCLTSGYNQAGIITADDFTIPLPLDTIQEILSGYITTQESSTITDLEEIRKQLMESPTYDACKLYLLMALPYLGNCDIDYIKRFVDDYNMKIQAIFYKSMFQYWHKLSTL